MAVDIKLKRSHTHSNIPTTSELSEGEFAVNTYDAKMYMRDGSSNIVTVGSHYTTDYESSTKTFYVTVASSTSAHVHHGSGSGNKYKINGVFSPYLKLIPGITYRFDQSDSSNSGHPFRFYLDENKSTSYTTGVTTNGTAGSSGAYTQIVISHSTPPVLHYQCSAHALMGWAAFVNTSNLTAFDTGDLTEGSNLYFTNARVDARITKSAIDALNVDADTLDSQDGTYYLNYNNFTNTPTIPSALTDLSISDGTSGQFLTTDGSGNFSFATLPTSGISNVVEDTTPQLGGNLDLNSQDITGTGNIDVTGNGTLTSTDAGSTAGPDLVLYRNSSSPADGDYIGQLQFKGKHDGGGDEIYAKVTGKISDSTQGTEDGLIETAVKGNGSFTIVSRQKSNELQLLNGVGLDVAGTLSVTGNTTLTGTLSASGIAYPAADGNTGQVITTDGSGNLSFASVGSLAGAGISNVSDDTSPQLGGDLDVATHSIVSSSNRNINLTPNGSGKVVVGTNGIEFGDGSVQTAAGADQGFAIAMGIALG